MVIPNPAACLGRTVVRDLLFANSREKQIPRATLALVSPRTLSVNGITRFLVFLRPVKPVL
jgi:hypothetical protein